MVIGMIPGVEEGTSTCSVNICVKRSLAGPRQILFVV